MLHPWKEIKLGNEKVLHKNILIELNWYMFYRVAKQQSSDFLYFIFYFLLFLIPKSC